MLFPLLTTALLLSGQEPAATDDRAAAQRLTLVESSPLETTLDSPDLPQTADVWKGMIDGAQREVLLSHFYASTAPSTPLNEVIESIEFEGEMRVKRNEVPGVTGKGGLKKEHPARPAGTAGPRSSLGSTH